VASAEEGALETRKASASKVLAARSYSINANGKGLVEEAWSEIVNLGHYQDEKAGHGGQQEWTETAGVLCVGQDKEGRYIPKTLCSLKKAEGTAGNNVTAPKKQKERPPLHGKPLLARKKERRGKKTHFD